MKVTTKLKSMALPLFVLALSGSTPAALATDDAATSSGPGNIGPAHFIFSHFASHMLNGRSPIHGILATRQHIYYVGDSLDIRVKFPRGADLLANGTANAHIVIFSHDGTVTAVPVPADIGTNSRKFFAIPSIDISALPAGQYQLGLIVTVPGGDPTVVKDWYSGFRALLDTEAIFISDMSMPGDANKDGEWDDDVDGNGIAGDEADEAELHAKRQILQ